MVHLVLSSTKGNQGQRYFPHLGYLGLTPIRVEGIVRTKLDADNKRLNAKSISISVRCYESRVGRLNTLHSNLLVDLTHTLWSKPDDVDYHPIGFSTAVFVDYRCVWRIEAVLHHAPITGLGCRQVRHFELPLVRYDVPSPTRPLSPPHQHETTKPRAPRIRYTIHAPTTPIGPHDLVSIPIHLHPLDPNVVVRSASVIVERRIILHDQPDDPPPTEASTSTLTPTITPATEHAPLLPHAPTAKVITNPVAGVESSGSFARDARGAWSKTLTLQWPAPKSHSRWAIGESIVSDLVSVKYFIRTKIIVTSPTGTESLELADHELQIVSANEAERQLALAKYNEALDADAADAAASSSSARSKSKSPRRARAPAPPPTQHVPSPWAPAAAHSRPITKARRPHTSAGPRDRPTDFTGGVYGPPVASGSGAGGGGGTTSDGGEKKRKAGARPDTGGSLVGGRNSASFWSTVHANGVQPPKRGKSSCGTSAGASASASASASNSASASVSTSTSGSVVSSASGKSSARSSARDKRERERERARGTGGKRGTDEAQAHMREWEEELARIEVRSRRSSDLLGFAGRMKRVFTAGGTPPVPVPMPMPVPVPVPMAIHAGGDVL